MFQKNKNKNKACQIFRKTNISFPLIRTCAYQEVRNVRFSEKFVVLCFLEICSFDLLPRNIEFRAEICIRELLSWKQLRYDCFQGSSSLRSVNLVYFFQIIVASYIISFFFRKNRIRIRRLFYLKNI